VQPLDITREGQGDIAKFGREDAPKGSWSSLLNRGGHTYEGAGGDKGMGRWRRGEFTLEKYKNSATYYRPHRKKPEMMRNDG